MLKARRLIVGTPPGSRIASAASRAAVSGVPVESEAVYRERCARAIPTSPRGSRASPRSVSNSSGGSSARSRVSIAPVPSVWKKPARVLMKGLLNPGS